jgi:S-adenosylmethionine:tRNA ribosyltransferase-isomerase
MPICLKSASRVMKRGCRLLERHGRLPLPPYITREPTTEDHERYQTVYARQPGAVAAPTAGLHFDPACSTGWREQGVEQAFITLHVGAGTFPTDLRVERMEDHVMHAERIEVSAAACEHDSGGAKRGGRVIAVGTTVTRALETATDDQGVPQPGPARPGFLSIPAIAFAAWMR